MKRIHRVGGFSLVEVLFSISLVMLLVGLTLPVLRGIREKSKSSVCMSNMRQIALGLSAYSADNAGYLPYLGTNSQAAGNGDTGVKYFQKQWPGFAWNYFNIGELKFGVNDPFMSGAANRGKRNIFRCPSSDKNQTKMLVPPAVVVPGWGYESCYGMIMNPVFKATSGGGGDCRQFAFHRSRIKNASITALLVEHTTLSSVASVWQQTRGLIPHAGGMNVAYYDGHIEFLNYNSIPQLSSDLFWDGF